MSSSGGTVVNPPEDIRRITPYVLAAMTLFWVSLVHYDTFLSPSNGLIFVESMVVSTVKRFSFLVSLFYLGLGGVGLYQKSPACLLPLSVVFALWFGGDNHVVFVSIATCMFGPFFMHIVWVGIGASHKFVNQSMYLLFFSAPWIIVLYAAFNGVVQFLFLHAWQGITNQKVIELFVKEPWLVAVFVVCFCSCLVDSSAHLTKKSDAASQGDMGTKAKGEIEECNDYVCKNYQGDYASAFISPYIPANISSRVKWGLDCVCDACDWVFKNGTSVLCFFLMYCMVCMWVYMQQGAVRKTRKVLKAALYEMGDAIAQDSLASEEEGMEPHEIPPYVLFSFLRIVFYPLLWAPRLFKTVVMVWFTFSVCSQAALKGMKDAYFMIFSKSLQPCDKLRQHYASPTFIIRHVSCLHQVFMKYAVPYCFFYVILFGIYIPKRFPDVYKHFSGDDQALYSLSEGPGNASTQDNMKLLVLLIDNNWWVMLAVVVMAPSWWLLANKIDMQWTFSA